jgi:DNA-binding beta-propeller fold protein YncE
VPLGLAVDGARNIYVSEHVNQRVSQFTTAGVFVRAWGFNVRPGGGKRFEVCTKATGCRPGEAGGHAGQLGFPGGVAVDDNENLYVTDPLNNRVSQFTTEGAFVRAFGFDVVPGGGRRFEICTPVTGCKRGVAGGRAGQLDRPAYVASDGAGSIYVTDEGNNRVNQFTTEGAFVRAWGLNVRPGGTEGFELCTTATGCRPGKPGGRAGALRGPDGVATDGAGNLYVADLNFRVSQFTTEGAFVRAFGFGVVPGGSTGFEICTTATGCRRGRAHDGVGGFISSSAVAADASGAIYVADAVANRIQCFGEPASVPCVRNLFRFGDLKRDLRRGTASLAVKVPGPGSLRVRGKRIKATREHAEAAGTVSLPIRPRCRARRALNREGEVSIRIHVTYRPRNGGPNTRVRRVELRQAPVAAPSREATGTASGFRQPDYDRFAKVPRGGP